MRIIQNSRTNVNHCLQSHILSFKSINLSNSAFWSIIMKWILSHSIRKFQKKIKPHFLNDECIAIYHINNASNRAIPSLSINVQIFLKIVTFLDLTPVSEIIKSKGIIIFKAIFSKEIFWKRCSIFIQN